MNGVVTQSDEMKDLRLDKIVRLRLKSQGKSTFYRSDFAETS